MLYLRVRHMCRKNPQWGCCPGHPGRLPLKPIREDSPGPGGSLLAEWIHLLSVPQFLPHQLGAPTVTQSRASQASPSPDLDSGCR